MSAPSSLSPKAAFWLVAVSVLFLGAAVVLVMLDDGLRPMPGPHAQSGPTARSTSALGYGAWVEMLEALHVPVIVTNYGAAEEGRKDALLVLLEPRAATAPAPVIDSLRAARTSLVTVPKWNWTADARRPEWIASASLLPLEAADRELREIIPGAALVRPSGAVAWHASGLPHRPTISQPQLIVSDDLTPLIASDQGILLGKLDTGARVTWVLSDPDLLSNHGIGHGDNAWLAAEIIDRLRPGGAPVVIDETVHGGIRVENAWRSFLEPPLIGVTAVFAATGLLLAWAAFRRFGTPIPEGQPIARGTSSLIESTTDLLRRHGSPSDMLGRYAAAIFREAAAAIAGPHRGSQPDIDLIMDEAARRSGARPYSALRAETAGVVSAAQSSPLATVKFATVLYQWKKSSSMDLAATKELCANIKLEVQKVVVGQEAAVELLLVGLLADGHILLEGVPGTAKTLLARAFAASLSLDFGRIQFTPDLMPGDVIGTNIFNFQGNDFRLIKGPVFTQVLLADEINRAPPKTQAALLQAMNERLVTIDGKDYPLGQGFMVIGTQNPIEQQGTYPLPEAQLDRFLFKHIVPYPSAEEEQEIVVRHGRQTTLPRLDDIARVADLERLLSARALVQNVTVSQDVISYVVEIVRATRQHPSLQFGASPRAAVMIASAARARATLAGRDFVLPDDVKSVVAPALRHRLVLAPGAELEAVGVEQVIDEIVAQTAAPR